MSKLHQSAALPTVVDNLLFCFHPFCCDRPLALPPCRVTA
jgi:hypothetical protein